MNEETIIDFIGIPVRETFYNEDSSWGTFKVRTETPVLNFEPDSNGTPFSKIKYYEGNVTGNMQRLEVGMEYHIQGKLKRNIKYGYSIEPSVVVPNRPTSIDSQKKFLNSILTLNQTNTLLEHYPNIVTDIMEGKEDFDFSLLKNITKERFMNIRDKIVDNFIISDILSFLSPLGISYKMIKTLSEGEKNPVLLKQKIEKNPYVLTSIKGMGFKKIDQLALKLRPELENSEFRALSYIKYYLMTMGDDEGHVWAYIPTLKENYMNNVPECAKLFDYIINKEEKNSMLLHIQNGTVGLKSRYEIAKNVVKRIDAINTCPHKYKINEEHIVKGITKANEFQGFTYDNDQVETIKVAVKEKFIVLTGRAGASKSSISRGILNVFKEANMSVACCALSAKASKVIQSSTGFHASTMHKLFNIGFGGRDNVNKNIDEKDLLIVKNNHGVLPQQEFEEFVVRDGKIITDVLLVDETSMINDYFINYILNHVSDETVVLFVGDDKQLPAIGYGAFLRDIIRYRKFRKDICVIVLNTIYRQAQKSGILSDANQIRENKNPLGELKTKMVTGELKDMFYMFFDNKEAIHKEAISKYVTVVAKEGLDNVVMISPMRENGINSCNSINLEVQDLLLENAQRIEFGDKTFKVGAKVMQIANNKDKNITNGEMGIMKSIATDGKSCIATLSGKDIKYTKGELKELQLAYCITVHKLQGDSYDTAIIVLDTSHYMLLDACLLYSALTRAKKRCMLIAQPSAYNQCIVSNKQINRQTYLGELLKSNGG